MRGARSGAGSAPMVAAAGPAPQQARAAAKGAVAVALVVQVGGKTRGTIQVATDVTQEAALAARYEKELMNPNEALSLGSISQIVMPSDLRKVLGENLLFHLRHYEPGPFAGVQREFH